MRAQLRSILFGACLTSAAFAAMALPLAAQTLTVAQSYDPTSLWPNSTTAQEQINVGNAIVEALFWSDPNTNKLMPVLATGYTMVSPTEVKISLRKGVKFSNGEDFNADAVIHSFKVFMDPAQAPGYARFAEPIASVSKIDDDTVSLSLKHPYPALDLIFDQLYITPPKYWDSVGGAVGFGQKPIGTGPFVLKQWVKDDHIEMDSNPSYWGTKPAGIDEIIWKSVPDDNARSSGLLAGEFDIASNLPISVASQIQQAGNLKLVEVPSYRVFSISLSTLDKYKGPLHDKRVRQALNYAVDKQAIVDSLFLGKAKTLSGQVLRPDQLGFDAAVKDYPFDPAKAKQLLADAGFAKGLELDFKFPSGRYAQDREVAEAVSGMLADVGVKTNMHALEAGEFLRQMNAAELAPLALVGFAPANDPDFQISQYRSDWRYSQTNSPELDALIDAGVKEVDHDKRAAIYNKALTLMHDDALALFLYDPSDLYGTSSGVSGFLPRGDQRWTVYGVSLTAKK